MLHLKDGWQKRYIWVFGLFLCMSFIVSFLYYRSLKQQTHENIARIQTIYADRTGNLVNNIFHKTDTLAAVVKLQNGNITEKTFNDIAQLVYQEKSGIRGIQYMPDAIVTFSYPVKGNEGVIGKNFLKIPERLKDVQLAIDTKSIALSGPYHLIQGGLGVVARNPIFLTKATGEEYFWGFSAIILDLPDALEAAGLGHLPESGYDFQLYCINENNERLIIAGNPHLNMANAVQGSIPVPHHQWMLAVSELNPWYDVTKAGILLLIGCAFSLAFWLLYSQLRQKQNAIKAKDKFFSDISHDMRTPLNAVLGFSNLALTPGLPETTKNLYLQKIQDAGKLLLDLINDTLTISKGNSGKIKLLEAPVNTEHLINPVRETIAVLAEAKGVDITWDLTKYAPKTVLADHLSVEKIFLNLLNNAVKFTPAGGHIWVTIQEEPVMNSVYTMVTTIKDDGIGMSTEFLPHIFEPFSQEQQIGYAGVGTGLGLSIVKQYVDLMGGTITVESQLQRGTTFKIHLPFKLMPSATATVSLNTENIDYSVLRGKKILLCEDNILNQQIALALLKNKGIVVEVAENGQIGVNKFTTSTENEFNAILMDIRMPAMDGFETTKAIRALKRADAKTIPIIAMTADIFPEDIKECLDAGMNNHLGKPIDAKLLYQTLVLELTKK